MITIVLTACPISLRGDLTKWLLEISPGVFVGNVNARIRDELWNRTTGQVRNGRAILAYSSDNEQRLRFKTHGNDWEPVDLEGLILIRRPLSGADSSGNSRTGWSIANAIQKSNKASWRDKYQT